MESRDNKDRNTKDGGRAQEKARLPPRLPKPAPIDFNQDSEPLGCTEHTPQLSSKLRIPGTPLPKQNPTSHTLKMAPVSALPAGKLGIPVSPSYSSPNSNAVNSKKSVVSQGLNTGIHAELENVDSEKSNECSGPVYCLHPQWKQVQGPSSIEFGTCNANLSDRNPGVQTTRQGELQEETTILNVSPSNAILAGDSVVGTIVVDKSKRSADPDVLSRRQPQINVLNPIDPLEELNAELERLRVEEGDDDEDSFDDFPTLTIEESEISSSKSISGAEASKVSMSAISNSELPGILPNEHAPETEVDAGAEISQSGQYTRLNHPKIRSRGLALLGLAICTVVVFAVAVQQGNLLVSRSVSALDLDLDSKVLAALSPSESTRFWSDWLYDDPVISESNSSSDMVTYSGQYLGQDLGQEATFSSSSWEPSLQSGPVSENAPQSSRIFANGDRRSLVPALAVVGGSSDPKSGVKQKKSSRTDNSVPAIGRSRFGSPVSSKTKSARGGSGIFVDRAVVGHAKSSHGCEVPSGGISAMKHRRTNVCFRVSRNSKDKKVSVLWWRSGTLIRRSTINLSKNAGTQKIRAFLPLEPGTEGAWKVEVLSTKGKVLASRLFTVVE